MKLVPGVSEYRWLIQEAPFLAKKSINLYEKPSLLVSVTLSKHSCFIAKASSTF
jgi:hypothetical protein